MRFELEKEDIDLIVTKTVEAIRPMLAAISKHEDNAVFDKKGLAQYLKVSESTLNALVSNRQIPYFKISSGQSGGVRFRKKDIDRWIQQQTTPAVYQVNYNIKQKLRLAKAFK